MSTTVTGVAAPSAAPPASAAPVQPAATAAPQTEEGRFQGLWDAQDSIDRKPPEDAAPPEQPDLTNAVPEGEGEVPQTETATSPTDATAEAAPAAEKAYGSLDEYLKDVGIETDAFMGLPVALKVDGRDQTVPLAELVKNYQLSSASYARLQQAANERAQVAQERQQAQAAAQAQIQQAQQLTQLAHQQLTAEFQNINWNQLRAENPALYSATFTDFQARNAQIQQALQQINAQQQQQAQHADTQRQQAIAAEREKLLAARPEWRDPVKAAEAQQAMTALGRQFGFTDAELLGITDHRSLLILDAAARHTQLQAKAPQVLKKVRAAPAMTSKPGSRQVVNPQKTRMSQAQQNWARSGFRDDAAAAALFENFA